MMRVIGMCSECLWWGAVIGSEALEPHDRARVLREAENPLMRHNPFTYQTLPNENPEVRRCGHAALSTPESLPTQDGAVLFSPTVPTHDARLCTAPDFGCALWERRDPLPPPIPRPRAKASSGGDDDEAPVNDR